MSEPQCDFRRCSLAHLLCNVAVVVAFLEGCLEELRRRQMTSPARVSVSRQATMPNRPLKMPSGQPSIQDVTCLKGGLLNIWPVWVRTFCSAVNFTLNHCLAKRTQDSFCLEVRIQVISLLKVCSSQNVQPSICCLVSCASANSELPA